MPRSGDAMGWEAGSRPAFCRGLAVLVSNIRASAGMIQTILRSNRLNRLTDGRSGCDKSQNLMVIVMKELTGVPSTIDGSNLQRRRPTRVE